MTSEQALIRNKQSFEATKTIGLIADTHVPKKAKSIPQKVFEVFQNVDFIIHAGDLVELEVIDELEQLAPVLAVHGNLDSMEVCSAFPELNSLKVFDWRIGVMHDPGAFGESGQILNIAKQNSFDAIVYGHTHTSKIKWQENILCINPGSPTDPSSFLNKPSVALLKITKSALSPQILDF